jgi:ribose transport system permease protein
MRRIIGLVSINSAFILIMALTAPVFVTWTNLSAMLANMALESIAMAGLTLLLVARLFDLSADGTVALTGVIVGKLMVSGWSPVAAILVGVLVGIATGLTNGLLVMRLKINPLIATLATWWIMTGMAFGLTKSVSSYGFPEGFQFIGQARILGVRIFVWYAVVILAVLAVMLAKTQIGRHIYIMGGNPEAGRLFGVNVDRLGIKLYVLMGFLAALVGIVLAARLDAGAPNAVDGMTMRVIAAAVIGGCSLSGGKGNILAGLLGLLLLNMLTNAATILGVSPYWQKSIIGGVLLLALVADVTNSKIRLPGWALRRLKNV